MAGLSTLHQCKSQHRACKRKGQALTKQHLSNLIAEDRLGLHTSKEQTAGGVCKPLKLRVQILQLCSCGESHEVFISASQHASNRMTN